MNGIQSSQPFRLLIRSNMSWWSFGGACCGNGRREDDRESQPTDKSGSNRR
jgi:hypothetical protein